MITITDILNLVCDYILPIKNYTSLIIGNWNENLKMFIGEPCDFGTGKTYVGIRSSNRLFTVFHIIEDISGWTYYVSLEIYIYQTEGQKMIGKAKMEDCSTLEFLDSVIESTIKSYIEEQLRLIGLTVKDEGLECYVKSLTTQMKTH